MTVLDRRTFYLGDDAPAQCQGQGSVTGVGTTDLACGFLRGWQRIFLRNGSTISIDGRSQGGRVVPVGDPPTDEEWREFDAQARGQGVGGLTAQLQKNARPSTDFLPSLSRAISATGRGIEAGKLDRAVKGAAQGLDVIASPLNRIVPGAGTVLENVAIGLVAPGFLANLVGRVGGVVSSVGPLAGTAYHFDTAAGVARQAGMLVGTEAKAVTIATGPGSLTSKLVAASMEAVAELSFAVAVVAIVFTAGAAGALDTAAISALEAAVADAMNTGNAAAFGIASANLSAALAPFVAEAAIQTTALTVLSLSLTAIQAGVTVATAVEASRALDKASKAASAKALADESALDKEIRDLQAEIARVKAETAGLSRTKATPAGKPASGSAKAFGLFLLAAVGIEVLT